MSLKAKKYYLELLNKLFNNSITKEELEKLTYFFLNNQELESWPEYFGSKKEIEKRIYKKIESDLKLGLSKESKIIPFYKKPLFKYAVAASIVLLISVTFIIKNGDSSIAIDPVNPIVVNNSIKPGVDKATLTLEDGSVVELDNNHTYKNQNIQSNGNQIKYKALNTERKEIAYNYLTIPRGGQYHLILSDGTQVWLNSESQLKYPVSFKAKETRKVELIYGEAYFDVSSSTEHNGAKFKVLNQFQEVEVFGTEFNIKAYKDELKVYTTLVEGKVAVNFEKNTQNLEPNQQSIWNLKTKSLDVRTIDVYNETSWRQGVFSFDNKSLSEIMKILSRWYDIDILIMNKDVETTEFVGILRKDRNLEDVIMNLKNLNVIEGYEIRDNVVLLK